MRRDQRENVSVSLGNYIECEITWSLHAGYPLTQSHGHRSTFNTPQGCLQSIKQSALKQKLARQSQSDNTLDRVLQSIGAVAAAWARRGDVSMVDFMYSTREYHSKIETLPHFFRPPGHAWNRAPYKNTKDREKRLVRRSTSHSSHVPMSVSIIVVFPPPNEKKHPPPGILKPNMGISDLNL